MRFTKKQKLLNDDLKIGTIYKLAEAISFLKKYASKKFDKEHVTPYIIRSNTFYKENYPESTPMFGFFTWKSLHFQS